MFLTISRWCFIVVFSSLAWAGPVAAQSDENIKENVVAALVSDTRVDASEITVEVNNGAATLGGTVPSYLAATAAYDVALETTGVTSVDNLISVLYQPPFSPPADPELRATILSKLARNPDINVLDTEITVEAGLVTLRGTVNSYWEKLHAEELVASEAGVVAVNNHLAIVRTDDFMDEEIAADIIQSLESRSAVSADDVTVSVQDGHVTLTGVVPSWAAKQAAFRSALFTFGVVDVQNLISVDPELS
ncbi:BON domain-containing protein [Desulfonatronum thioautotrophicum]|uniref:BON domain-containing protein n=1 Tax=Desulfonatronum thioautotrophicum TaxID=617001 RepID=UPI0005EB25CD|nr:BON domain-containing protein [Desulfonatronum thioautotrophicum]